MISWKDEAIYYYTLKVMNKKILSLKHITPEEKLVLLLIEQWNPLMTDFNLTSQEIADELGLKRKTVLNIIGALEERDYIECEVGYRSRKTRLTKRFKTLINNSVENDDTETTKIGY